MKRGILFVVSAPSGAGKSTLIERIRKLFPDMRYSVSCTTRQPRGSEIDGIHYFFLSPERFKEMIDEQGFLEWKTVHGNFYGSPAAPVNEILQSGGRMILDIDVQGAQEVFRRIPDAVGIFINAPDQVTLERRLRERGTDSEESIRTRMRNAAGEIEMGRAFRHQVVNDDIETAVAELARIIEDESRGQSGGTILETCR